MIIVKVNKLFKSINFVLKNIILVKEVKKRIIIYSVMKIIVNKPLLYSVLNPETSSLSPSVKSNGVRLSSATQEIIHIRV